MFNKTATAERPDSGFTGNSRPTEKLTISDRCSRCTQPARALFTKAGVPGELPFCGHHANKFEPALLAQGFTATIDERQWSTTPAGKSNG